MDLSSLKSLGLPEWLLILAALVFILKQIGVLDFIYSRLVDRTEHKQQSQSDALSSSLDIANRVIDHIIETNNGRLVKIEERLSQAIGLLRNVEGQQTITNRDWSRMEEILSDIDMAMHEIKASLKIDDKDN